MKLLRLCHTIRCVYGGYGSCASTRLSEEPWCFLQRSYQQSPLTLLLLFPSKHSSQHILLAHCVTHLVPRSPHAVLQPQSPEATGDAVFPAAALPDRGSCSTNTTSPLVLRLLIPPIRRHGRVMTGMISPSTALLHVPVLIRTKPVDWASKKLSQLHLHLHRILSWFYSTKFALMI